MKKGNERHIKKANWFSLWYLSVWQIQSPLLQTVFGVILLLLQYMILITWRALKWIFKRRMKKRDGKKYLHHSAFSRNVIKFKWIYWPYYYVACSFVYLINIIFFLKNYKLVDDESFFSDSQLFIVIVGGFIDAALLLLIMTMMTK